MTPGRYLAFVCSVLIISVSLRPSICGREWNGDEGKVEGKEKRKEEEADKKGRGKWKGKEKIKEESGKYKQKAKGA